VTLPHSCQHLAKWNVITLPGSVQQLFASRNGPRSHQQHFQPTTMQICYLPYQQSHQIVVKLIAAAGDDVGSYLDNYAPISVWFLCITRHLYRFSNFYSSWLIISVAGTPCTSKITESQTTIRSMEKEYYLTIQLNNVAELYKFRNQNTTATIPYR
jgi:hypothetical protein